MTGCSVSRNLEHAALTKRKSEIQSHQPAKSYKRGGSVSGPKKARLDIESLSKTAPLPPKILTRNDNETLITFRHSFKDDLPCWS